MEAVVTCTQEGQVWEASMKCDYTPEGESTVEVTAPETIAGVKAVITQEDWSLAYEDVCLNAGTLSEETVSPAVCLPRLMSALRDGWLLEENREDWNEVACQRLTLDQTGSGGGKIVSDIWLRQDTGTPEEDAEKAAEILQKRIDDQAAGGAWYPESMEAWGRGQVIQEGIYVAMIASAEHQEEIADAFEGLFA